MIPAAAVVAATGNTPRPPARERGGEPARVERGLAIQEAEANGEDHRPEDRAKRRDSPRIIRTTIEAIDAK